MLEASVSASADGLIGRFIGWLKPYFRRRFVLVTVVGLDPVRGEAEYALRVKNITRDEDLSGVTLRVTAEHVLWPWHTDELRHGESVDFSAHPKVLAFLREVNAGQHRDARVTVTGRRDNNKKFKQTFTDVGGLTDV